MAHLVPPAVRLVPVLAVLTACAGGRFAQVSPDEIPELRQKVSQQPNNGDLLLRLSAAHFAAGQCDSALVHGRAGMRLAPANAVGPLVVGQCLERAAQDANAISVYREFLASHPDTRGVAAVRAREMIAARQAATRDARQALAREAELEGQADPQTVAVLPLAISGDSAYRPLSRGLAQILTSDLALLRRFRMVERLQLNALLGELALAETGRVDVSTAARVGRLMQAGRMVQGLAAISPDAHVRLEASVVQSTGEVTQPASAEGRFRDLLLIEKDLVIGLAARLGYQLSEAERRTILENGTQVLVAFLAYSRGLEAEDLGDYAAAAAYYGQASQADPNFQAARERFQATQAAPQVQQAAAQSEVMSVAAQRIDAPVGPDPTELAVTSTVGDLAPTQTEQTVSDATTQTAITVVTTTTQQAVTIATIRIVFRLP